MQVASDNQDSLIGQLVGGSYEIVRRLGEGGMGTVYLATSRMLADKPAAVKVLTRESSSDPGAMARFRAEIFATGKITDPNIVRVFDAGTLPDGRVYMIMEYCNGGSLQQLLEQKERLPLDLALSILGSIASVLDEAHNDAGITHRDIKPGNILLVKEKGGPLRARLADFGIAKLHRDKIDDRAGTRAIMGSIGYMSPEQSDARIVGAAVGGVDHRADVYGLGCVLYQMVTGRHGPYEVNNLFQLIEAFATNRSIPAPMDLRPDLPAACDRAIKDALVVDRNRRTQTVSKLAIDFAAGLQNGDALLAVVAPRLMMSRMQSMLLPPSATTISHDIGPASLHLTDAAAGTKRARAPKPQWLVTGAAALACSALSVAGYHVMSSGAPAGTTAQVASAQAAPLPEKPVIVDAPIAVAMPAQPPVPTAVIVADARPADAPIVAVAPVRPVQPAQQPVIGAASATARKEAAAMGVLQIAADPFAEVFIDGKAVGSAPVTKRISVGPHKVKLVGPDSKTKNINADVVAGKPTTIDWRW